MLDSFDKFYAMVLAESMQADFIAILIFVLWIGVGSLFHELGHMTAARLCGIRETTLAFRPVNGKHGLPFPALEIDEKKILVLSRNARRFIFAGGATADVLIAILIWCVLPNLALPHGIVVGILGGVTLRGALFWVNLVPLSHIRSDGWRILNPDSPI